MKKNQVPKTKTHLEKITDRKIKNVRLVEITKKLKVKEEINMTIKTIQNIKECGSWLEFLADKKLEKRKLNAGVFCGNRFCPICSKKKSLKDALAIKIMTEYIKQELNKEFILVTLTAPNIEGQEISKEIQKYNKAFDRLIKRKRYFKVIQGYLRKLEVTYNNKKESKSYKTYHPHFHILIAVNKSYFTDTKQYISRDEWLKDWQEVMQDKTITQVDVRRLKTKTKDELDKSILEITKYIAKDSNYLTSEEVFCYFYKGLKGKRQYAFGGLFKKARELYKKGELDKYKLIDETEWYYKITNKWQGKKYSEKIEILEEE